MSALWFDATCHVEESGNVLPHSMVKNHSAKSDRLLETNF
jgi:hypothetical protein